MINAALRIKIIAIVYVKDRIESKLSAKAKKSCEVLLVIDKGLLSRQLLNEKMFMVQSEDLYTYIIPEQ